MPTTHKMLAVAVATAIAIGGAAATYIATSDASNGYVSLVSSKDSANIPKAITQLDSNQIKYKITSNGDLLVDEDQIVKARNLLAKNGQLFSSKSGYDLLNKEQSIFINSTQQQLQKTQILEENLQLTLELIDGVDAAKVHISLSETSEFMRDTNKSTASIMLEVDPSRRLTENQVHSIKNLASSSVPFLSPDDVVITDQFAQLLSGDNADNYAMSMSQIKHKTKLEKGMHTNIMQVIAPLIGFDYLRVSVNADINYDKVQNTKEQYITDPLSVANEELEYNYDEANSGSGKGVPGALSNQPPGHVKLSEKDKAPSTSSSNSSVSYEKISRNYNTGRSVTNTEYGGMALNKLDVVVLIDKKTLEEDFEYKPDPIKLPDEPEKPVEPEAPTEPEFVADTKPQNMNEEQKSLFDKYTAEKSKYDADLATYNEKLEQYKPLKEKYDAEVKVLNKQYEELTAAERKVELQNFIDTRIKNIEQMTKGAAGFNKQRGDTVTVIADSFIHHKPLEKRVYNTPEPADEAFKIDDYTVMAINTGIALLVLIIGVLLVRRKSSAKDKAESTTGEQEQNIQDILSDVMSTDTSFTDRSESDIAKAMTKDQLSQDNLNAEDVDLDALIEIAKENLSQKQKPALIIIGEWLDNKTDLRDAVIAEIKDNNEIVRISKAGSTDQELFEPSDNEMFSDDIDIDSLIEQNSTFTSGNNI